jgi:MFS family permease
MGLADSLAFFYLVAILIGILSESGGPAHQAMTADLLPEEKRAQGFGLLRVAFNLAVTIGPAIGGFLAARSYLSLFIADAVISLISAAIVFRYLQETKPELKPGEKAESMGQTFGGYLHVLRDGIFMLFLGACILMVLVYMNMNTTLGVYLRDVFGIAEWGYGALLSLNALMVVLFQFAITRRIEGVPPMLVMAGGTALYAVGFGMYGLVAVSAPFQFVSALFILAMVILTIGEMLVAPTAQAVTAKLAPEHMRGRYMAVFGMSYGLPFMVGPLLAGMWMDNADPRGLWLIAGALGFIGSAGFLLLHRLVQRTPAPAQA